MKVIGYVEHPVYKITVFKMDLRINIQFEHDRYVQTYRFTEHPLVFDLSTAQSLVTPALLAQTQSIFEQMHLAQISATGAMHKANATEDEVWDEVI